MLRTIFMIGLFAVAGLFVLKLFFGVFGGLLALTMGTAFLAEVFVLPATIKLVPWFQGEGRRDRAESSVAAGVETS